MSSIKDLTTEELLKAVGEKKPTVKPYEEVERSLHEFIKEFGVASGKTRVPNYVIFYNYMNWQPHGKKLSKIQFFRNFNKYFTQKRDNSTRYYLLKQGTFEINSESKQHAKEYNKEYEEKVKRKKSKTKEKVSSSR